MPRSPSPTTKADFQKNKSKILSNKPKDSKTKIKKSERELKPKTDWKATVSASNTLLMMKKSKTNSMLLTNKPSVKNSKKLKTGHTQTLKPTLLNSKQNKKNLRPSSTQSCKKSIKLPEVLQEDSQEDNSQADNSPAKEVNKEDQPLDQLLIKLIDL